MKKSVAALAALLIALLLCACGNSGSSSAESSVDARETINLTAGGAKTCFIGEDVYAITEDGIVVFNVKNDSLAQAKTFKSGSYTDLCVFSGRLAALETVSDERQELISIDPKSGEETVLQVLRSPAGTVWFSNVFGGKLYLRDNGSVYSLDKSGNFGNTGYGDPLLVTEEGIFINSNAQEGTGLVFVPKINPNEPVIEFAGLKGKPVTAQFHIAGKTYLVVDNNRPASVSARSASPDEVTYLDMEGIEIGSNDLVRLSCLYAAKQLIVSVAHPDEWYSSWDFDIYLKDPDAPDGSKKIARLEDEPIPLCWVSSVDTRVFVSDLRGVRSDWTLADE